MGFRNFSSFLILSLFCKPLVSLHQEPNSDESFVLTFLQKMGSNPNPPSVPLCSIKGIYCDENGENVLKLEMSGWGLSGSIPDATIGKLINLVSLDLSYNRISYLPDDFWGLVSLKYLNLSCNQISGTIPGNIAYFDQLKILDLSFNDFYGPIPDAISLLSRLQILTLSGNRLNSMIPLGILHCRSLVYIDLSSNNIVGPLPSGFGSAFPELRFLNLADNQITGRASHLVGLRAIRFLNVSVNRFRGSVVGVFEGLMEVVDLRRNYFQGLMGQVRSGSTFDWSNLVYLDISENRFSGEFSDHLSLAINLRYLNLADNRFSEQQFLRVDSFSSLEYLNLSSTGMIGPIPSNISRLSSLRLLDLSHNLLTNRIPSVFTNNLRVLDLSYNNLSGNIPYMLLQQLQSMDKFNFSINNLNYCVSQFPGQSSFIGLTKNCPIATDPAFIPRKPSKQRELKLTFVITLSLSCFCFLIGLLLVAFRYRYNPSSKPNPPNEELMLSGSVGPTNWVADISQPTSVPVVIFHKPLLNFTFADLLYATSNFDRATLLAEGRFGPVYRGLLPGGLHIAIKVLARGSTMTDQEATREIEYLGRINHHNLVPLMGYCMAGDQKIAIYEYMENGNLQNLLHDLPLRIQTTEEWEDENGNNINNDGMTSTWSFRHKIMLGTARALAFLHHGCSPPIIHRDVKASSVYLDSFMDPRLSDFGLAKMAGNGLEDGMARASSAGYVSPEFFELGSPKAPTPKSDVYGFGVVLLELVTGKRPVGDDYPDREGGDLVSWVRRLVRRSRGSQAIDPKIHGTGPDESMEEALKIGYLCTAEVPSKRPSMHQVVGLLKDIEPNQPSEQ